MQRQTTLKYCKQYGFDADAIAARLSLVNLSTNDLPLADRLHNEVIAHKVDDIVDAFYVYMLSQPQMRYFLDNDRLIEKLRGTQREYLLSLGRGFNTCEYFEERLRVGLAHARVGIPVSLYLCAYRMLSQAIRDAFPESVTRVQTVREALSAFVYKITMLDMSLAVETYHRSTMHNLEKSLEFLKEEELLLRQLAVTDALTGLPNHGHVVSLLAQTIEDARREGTPTCIVMADLDFFKQINDTYGHLIGDSVLREVALRLRAALRDVDVVGRYGGEEFIVIFANTTQETAFEIAERVRDRVGSTPINLQGLTINITISLGLCLARADDDVSSLIKCADEALYHAKREGRNRVIVASEFAARH